MQSTYQRVTSSIANANEQVNIILRVQLKDGYEDIQMNDQVLIRGNMEYHNMVEHARKLQKKLKEPYRLIIGKSKMFVHPYETFYV